MWKASHGERVKLLLEILVANEALLDKLHCCNHLVRRYARFMPKTRISYFRFIMQVLWNLVDERGFEPPPSSLRTRKNLS